MPCDQLRETTLNLDAANLDLLKAALESEGCTSVEINHDARRVSFIDRSGYRGLYDRGSIRIDSASAIARDPNALKRAYSRKTLEANAKRFGWSVKEQPNSNNRRFVVQKRK